MDPLLFFFTLSQKKRLFHYTIKTGRPLKQCLPVFMVRLQNIQIIIGRFDYKPSRCINEAPLASDFHAGPSIMERCHIRSFFLESNAINTVRACKFPALLRLHRNETVPFPGKGPEHRLCDDSAIFGNQTPPVFQLIAVDPVSKSREGVIGKGDKSAALINR